MFGGVQCTAGTDAPLQRPSDTRVRLREDLTPAERRAARESAGETLVLPDASPRAVRGLESSAALPERLAVATAASRRADFGGARTVPRTSVTERPLRR
ncbi:hypothetical protein M2169_000745 [Streptomyces sp. MJP52]|nr:hypothetical protein [Streptomyces sp. MJP52]